MDTYYVKWIGYEQSMIENPSLTHKAKDRAVANSFLFCKWKVTITEITPCQNILLS